MISVFLLACIAIPLCRRRTVSKVTAKVTVCFQPLRLDVIHRGGSFSFSSLGKNGGCLARMTRRFLVVLGQLSPRLLDCEVRDDNRGASASLRW